MIDGATNTVSATVPAGGGPFGGGVDPATATVYLTNQGGDNTVSVIATLPGAPGIGTERR